MVNMANCVAFMAHSAAKLSGMEPKKIEVEPAGTVINFWVPSKIKLPKNKKPKKALVFLHGFAGDGVLTWLVQILTSSLRKKFTIYVPELVFFGGSYTTSSHRTPQFQADCMAQGLRKLGVVNNCIVVGFSYGGLVGFQMASHYPELVESLVLCGSTMDLTQSMSSKILERIGFGSWNEYLLPTTPKGVEIMFTLASFSMANGLPNILYRHYLQAMFSNRKERGELLHALIVKDEDVTSTTYQIQQRIHLLWGGEDKIFDMEIAQNLKEELGEETKLVIVKRAGHLAMLERPFVFNKCLKQILGIN